MTLTQAAAAVVARCKQRRKQVRAALRRGHVDALLLTHDRDIRYLSGFTGEDSWALLLARGAKYYVLSDARYSQDIPAQAPDAALIVRPVGTTLADQLPQLIARHKIERLAIQPDHISARTFGAVQRSGHVELLSSVDDGLVAARSVKDGFELAQIRKAIKIQQQAFIATREWLKPGQSENEIAAQLEYEMRRLGSEGPAFETIVGAGPNSSKPHYSPSPTKKLKRGEVLLVDWGATVGGYRSDMTRVLTCGKVPAKMREIYQVVLDAQQAAIDVIGPGVPLVAVDRAARGLIADAGYGDHFQHGLGHGIGLCIHEAPGISPTVDGTLVEGQVVTVEPGIYLPGLGGVRIEDDVLVTERGRKVLSDLPKSLDSAAI